MLCTVNIWINIVNLKHPKRDTGPGAVADIFLPARFKVKIYLSIIIFQQPLAGCKPIESEQQQNF